jgi:hypothetical protein
VIPVALAAALEDAGLRWHPQAGDAFVIRGRDMDDDVFYLADMTVEVHRFPGGDVIGFNGTVEWALDSIDRHEALWLPREDQLRTALGDALERLEREGPGWVAVVRRPDQPGRRVRAATPAEAYGAALLGQLLGEEPKKDRVP